VEFFNALGFYSYYDMLEEWGAPFGTLHVIKLSNKGSVIELVLPEGNYLVSNAHVAITVKDLEATVCKLRSLSKVIVEPRLSPDQSVKVAFCEDPNGIIVELVQPL
jgi:catechol 2,3-dioxygenase-like lactoylglutathione lyase family enzyme